MKNLLTSVKRIKWTKKLVATIAIVSLTLSMGAVYAFDYDPFEKYGKYLPWSEINNWADNKSMILTANPYWHYSGHGYYAQDFARYLPQWTLDTKVHAISDGTVVEIRKGWGNGYYGSLGNYVIIDHGNGYKTRYSHLGLISLTNDMIGETIRAGTEIGMVGESGNVTAPNLELTMYKGNQTVRAFDDGGDFIGEYQNTPWDGVWREPVTSFDRTYTKYRSNTVQRDEDIDNPWDPAYYDPLVGYLENYGYMFPSGMVAEPVNAATGNFVHRSMDLSIDIGSGPALEFERFYNSLDEYQGPNGSGWSHTYNIQILAHRDPALGEEEAGATLYSVKFADGHGETFKEFDDDPTSFTNTFTSETNVSLGTLTRADEDNNYRFEYTSPEGVVYFFNSDRDMDVSPSVPSPHWGKIEKLTDLNENSLTFNYNNSGDLAKVTNDVNQYLEFAYSNGGLLEKVADNTGRDAKYSYDFDGNLADVTKQNSQDWSYTYNGSGVIETIVDAENKLVVSNTYDNSGRVTKQRDGNNGITQLAYTQDGGNIIAKITSPEGDTTEYVHDENMYLVETVDPKGNSLKKKYDDNGQVIKLTLPDGQDYKYERDENGDVTKETKPDGSEIDIEYNEAGLPIRVNDPQGEIQYQYNSQNLLIEQRDQAGRTTRYQYDNEGRLIKRISPDLNSVTFAYNNLDQVIKEKDTSTGYQFEYKYDLAGNKIETKDILGRTISMTYDEFGNRLTITDAESNTKRFEYDNNGNIKAEVDENNNRTQYISDANENITEIKYADGTRIKYEFDSNNRKVKGIRQDNSYAIFAYDLGGLLVLEEVYAANGDKLSSTEFGFDDNGWNDEIITVNGTTKQSYDDLGRLEKSTNVGGNSRKYEYNYRGQVVEETDYLGNKIYFEYDVAGNLIKSRDQEGNVTEREYDKRGNVIKEIDPNLQETKYFYNSAGQIESIENPLGDKWFYVYDVAGRMIEQSNYAGETTYYKYDNNDNLIEQWNKAGDKTITTYDSKGNVKTQQNELGGIQKYTYDEMGRIQTHLNEFGGITEYSYDKLGNLDLVTQPDNIVLKFTYDTFGRKLSETDGLGNLTTFKYDLAGNLVEIKVGDAVTTLAYDELNRLISRTNAENTTTQWEYNPDNTVKKVIDPYNETVKYGYNDVGQVTSIQNQLGYVKSMKYDNLGNLIEETDFKGVPTTYNYNVYGQLEEVISRDLALTRFTYDEMGRDLSNTDGLDRTIQYLYDDLGNLELITDPTGAQTQYQYNALGAVESVTDANGKVSHTNYSPTGVKAEEIDALGNKTEYKYNTLGQLVEVIDAEGNPTNYQYDKNGNIEKVTFADDTFTQAQYNNFNLPVTQTNANLKTTNYTYDNLGQVIKQTRPDGIESTSKYDLVGNLIEQSDWKGKLTEYSYDEIGRVVSMKDRADAETTYKYDKNNNILEITNPLDGKISYEYDVMDRQIQLTDAMEYVYTYEYDRIGNLVAEKNPQNGVTEYSYTDRNKVASITDANDSTYRYEYNPTGTIAKAINPQNGEINYVYDDAYRVVEEVDPMGNSKFITYDKVNNVKAIKDRNSHTTSYIYDEVYNQLSITDALGNRQGFTYDANGNVLTHIDANSNITKYGYNTVDQMTSTTLAGGEISKYTYDANGNASTFVDGNQGSTTYSYDVSDNVVAVVDPLGGAVKYKYDALNRPIQTKDQIGAVTQSLYDPNSRLVSVMNALNRETTYQYDEVGNLVVEANANNNSTKYSYDLLGNLLTEENALGNEWDYTYDEMSNVISMVDPNGDTDTYTYDKLGRQVKLESPDDVHNFTFDPEGNLIATSDNEAQSSFEYDATNMLTRQEDNRGNVFNYSYDPVGNRVSVEYPDGKEANYEYNRNNLASTLNVEYAGDLIAANSPQTLTTEFAYDDNLNLISQVNPNNTVINYNYDANNRVTQVVNVIAEVNDEVIAFAQYDYILDPRGYVTNEVSVTKVDDFLRCENVDNYGGDGHNPYDCMHYKGGPEVGSQWNSQEKKYNYDVLGQVTTVKTYQSDHLATFQEAIEGREYTQAQYYSYDNVGNRTQYRVENQLSNPLNPSVTTYQYNAVNQINEDSNFDYSFDANGNLLSKVEKDGDYFYNYTYNSLDELTNAQTETEDGLVYLGRSENTKDVVTFDFDYEYDSLGRRISKVNNTDYTFCKGNGEQGNDKNSHDCDNGQGNDLLEKDSNTYQETSLPYYGIEQINYAYDGVSFEMLFEQFDRLEAPNGTPPSAGSNPHIPSQTDYFDTHSNFYKLGGRLVATQNIADRELQAFVDCKGNGEHYGDDNWFDCDNGSGNDDKTQFTDIGITRYNTNEFVNYAHYNSLGSVVGQTSYDITYKVEGQFVNPVPTVNSPIVYNNNSYDTFGELTKSTYEKNDNEEMFHYYVPNTPYAFEFTNWNTHSYSSKELDQETGLYNYGVRYYDATNGLWTQQDTYRGALSDPASRHRYMFVGNNPVNMIDRYGHAGVFSGQYWADTWNAVTGDFSEFDDGRALTVQNNAVQQNRYEEQVETYQADVGTANALADSISQSNAEISGLSQQIGALQRQSQAAYWSMKYAKHSLNNHTQMGGVVGRLYQRGYELDYNDVFTHLASETQKAGNIFSQRASQYHSILSAISSAINTQNSLISNVNSQSASLQEQVSSINSRTNSLQIVGGLLEDQVKLGYEFEAAYAEMKATSDLSQAVIGVAGCGIVTVVTVGGGAGACTMMLSSSIMNSASAINNVSNSYDYQSASVSGVYVNSKATFFEGMGADNDLANNLANGVDMTMGFVDASADFLLVAGLTAGVGEVAAVIGQTAKVVKAGTYIKQLGAVQKITTFAAGTGGQVALNVLKIGGGLAGATGGGYMVYGGVSDIKGAVDTLNVCSSTGACTANNYVDIGDDIGTGVYTAATGAVGIYGGLTVAVDGVNGGVGMVKDAIKSSDTNIINSNQQYSTLFQADTGSGASRTSHRNSANNEFFAQMEDSPEFKGAMDELFGYDVMEHMKSGSGALKNPSTEWVWHHPADTSGKIDLIPKAQHQLPELQPILHPGPNGEGGFGLYN